MKVNSLRTRVRALMASDQKYRDNDKELILQVWAENGLKLTAGQRYLFYGLPSADVIVRRRREFSGLYPASPKVAKQRQHKEEEFVEEFSKQNWLWRKLKKRGVA